jgi:hypothetical protein
MKLVKNELYRMAFDVNELNRHRLFTEQEVKDIISLIQNIKKWHTKEEAEQAKNVDTVKEKSAENSIMYQEAEPVSGKLFN